MYEGRYTNQTVNKDVDKYFQTVSEDLTDYEKTDLKKVSQRSHIMMPSKFIPIRDIAKYYQQNFQGTGLKGQLVCSSKRTAIKYFNNLRHIGIVDVALIMSPPDDREGEDSVYGLASDKEEVKKF